MELEERAVRTTVALTLSVSVIFSGGENEQELCGTSIPGAPPASRLTRWPT